MNIKLTNAARFLFLITLVLTTPVSASPNLGTMAPLFEGIDSYGDKVSLSNFLGKTIILEWTNHECPYVKRQYETGNMQMVQKKAHNMGVIWISIISSAPGTQGYVSSNRANELTVSRTASPTHVIMDQTGVIGRSYGARTTPHMYIISEAGLLIYMGAIDSDPTSWGEIQADTKNFVLNALGELRAGKKITDPSTLPYGCSVKYGS